MKTKRKAIRDADEFRFLILLKKIFATPKKKIDNFKIILDIKENAVAISVAEQRTRVCLIKAMKQME